MKLHIENIGCFKNLVDSERLFYALEKSGFDVSFGKFPGVADIAIINTCGFISDAENDSVQLINDYAELKRQGKISQLWVMGCYGQKCGGSIQSVISEVDRVFGNFDWEHILHLLKGNVAAGWKRHVTTPGHYAYLKISEGCNRPCAYCIKPILNGALVSVPLENLLEEVKWLVSRGVHEFQLVAQNLTDYGFDLYGEKRIAELVERIADIRGVDWIRLHYAYPIGFPSRLLDVMKERENVCKYLDMALQHCNSFLLDRMRRKMRKEDIIDLLDRIREKIPGICLRTTLMVGFPGETDAIFDELCAFVEEQRFERLGVFRYSAQHGSYSYEHYEDTVPEQVKRLRALKLMDMQKRICEQMNASLVGTLQRVIVDSCVGGEYHCRTEYSTPMADPKVIVASDVPLKVGSFQEILITGFSGKDLRGVLNDR